jgi:predicted nucleotidyltransferase component of viral defense system
VAPQILTPFQQSFIAILAKNRYFKEHFYLTGGTALAAYYLHHRYSEDLDLFSLEEVELLSVNAFLQKIKASLNIVKTDFQQTFNRNIFFLHTKREILKVEFTYFPFEQIEKQDKKDGILIDSILDIAVNKTFTIFQNPRARDFIDLFLILKERKELSIPNLVKMARSKFDSQIDPIQLGTQFLKAKDIQDLPRMIKKINHQQWRAFFTNQAKSLSKQIFK